MNRKEGYYWVKLKDELEWDVAYFNPEGLYWKIIGSRYVYHDKEFESINETQILPPNN